MLKIKDIRERLIKNPSEYLEIQLLVAKRTLAFSLLLYYVALLFTIGGFSFSFLGIFVSLQFLSALTFHLYSVLAIVIAWFIFSLVEYIQNIYYPNKIWMKYAWLVVAGLFALFALLGHLRTPFF